MRRHRNYSAEGTVLGGLVREAAVAQGTGKYADDGLYRARTCTLLLHCPDQSDRFMPPGRSARISRFLI